MPKYTSVQIADTVANQVELQNTHGTCVEDDKSSSVQRGASLQNRVWELLRGCALTAMYVQTLSVPPTPGRPHKWGKKTALLDVENNGYT